MLKKFTLCALLGAMLFAAGCRTNQVLQSPPVEGQTTVSGAPVAANLEAVNYGIFLFGFIPILSGDPNRPNAQRYWMFSNTVKDKYMKHMMNRYTRQVVKAKGIEEYKSTTEFSGAYSLWIVCRRTMRASAVAVK